MPVAARARALPGRVIRIGRRRLAARPAPAGRRSPASCSRWSSPRCSSSRSAPATSRSRPATCIAALAGGGDAGTTFIVRDLRLPRALCALLVGVALGISGAIFQSLTRNPLGSPDIIGFAQGASVGALIVITILGRLRRRGLGRRARRRRAHRARRLRAGLQARRHLGLPADPGRHRDRLPDALDHRLPARPRADRGGPGGHALAARLAQRPQLGRRRAAGSSRSRCCCRRRCPAGRALRALELGDDAAHALGVRVERARLGLVALAVGARLGQHRWRSGRSASSRSPRRRSRGGWRAPPGRRWCARR